MTDIDLGPCCFCEKEGRSIRNIIMLNKKTTVPGTGWGCVQCDLPLDGAITVLCDECMKLFEQTVIEPIFAVDGQTNLKKRALYTSLTGTHGHDPKKHPELTESRPWTN